MQSFVLFAVLAAVLFASASLLSKHLLAVEVEDRLFTGAIFGWPFFVLYILLGLYRGGLVFQPVFSMTMALAGAIYSLVLILYLRGLSEDEASRFIPTIAVNTVLVAVLSFVFLGKTFGPVEYLGMFLAFAGAFILSLKTSIRRVRFSSRKASGLALITAFLIAFRDILIDSATASYSLWSGLLWMGLGGLAASFVVLTVWRREELGFARISRQKKMLGVGSLRATGFLAYAVSISLGPAAKASAVLKLNSLLVFLGATALAVMRPGFIQEEVGKAVTVQKLVASLMILAGILMVR